MKRGKAVSKGPSPQGRKQREGGSTAPLKTPAKDESLEFSSDEEREKRRDSVKGRDTRKPIKPDKPPSRPAPRQSPPSANVMSFDDFIQSLSSSKQSPAAPHKPDARRSLAVSKSPPKPSNALLEAKAEALRREKERQRRKAAATLIQRWFRSKVKPRLSAIRQRLQRLLTRYTLRRVKAGLAICAEWRKREQAKLIEKYENVCAEMIQRTWRRYCRGKSIRRERDVVREKLAAVVRGWKVRKVMRSWMLQDCISRVKNSSGSERTLFVAELIAIFAQEYKGGRWMRTRKPKKSILMPTRRTPKLQLTPRKSENESLPPKRYVSPAFSTAELTEEPSSADTSRTASPLSRSLKPLQPFLRRKNLKVQCKKLDLTKVKTKVSCWTERKPANGASEKERKEAVLSFLKRNSLEEFVALEKRHLDRTQHPRYRQKLPIPRHASPQRSSSQPAPLRLTLLGVLETPPKVNITKVTLQKTAELTVRMKRLEPKDDRSEWGEDDGA